jgi:hypothetical protein
MVQFLRPDGRSRLVLISRPPEIEGMAGELIRGGYRFEVEVLRDLTVSLEVVGPETDTGEPISLAHEIAPNNDWIPAAVDRLVRDAHEALLATQTKIEA